MGKKNPIQVVLLLAFIVIIPLGSWYYLKRGYDYRKEAMEELKDYGKLPTLAYSTVDGKENVVDSLSGKMVIAHLLNTENEDLTTQFGKTLKKLHEQFKNTGRLAIVTLGVDPTKDDSKSLEAFAKAYDLWDQPHYYLIAPDSTGISAQAKQLYLPESDFSNSPYFVLADSSSMVKNHYQVTDEASVQELVMHSAMFMPRKPKRKIIFKRETEK